MNHSHSASSQVALLEDFFVAPDVIANLKVGPALEADTTFGIFAHFGHVLLDILE